MRLELFARFMDYIVYPIMWCCSPGVRAHARAVKYQDDHLYHGGHNPPVDECGWCQEAQRVCVIGKGTHCHLQGVRYNAKPCAGACELGSNG